MLEDLIHELLRRDFSFVDDNNPSIGTPLFTQILPNKYPLRLYSLNHPEIFLISRVVEDYHDYHHKLLYLPLHDLTSHPSLTSLTYSSYINTIRRELGFPPLLSPPSDISLIQQFDDHTLQDLPSTFTFLGSMLNTDISPILYRLYRLLELNKLNSVDKNQKLNSDLLQNVLSLLTSLSSQHPSPVVRRECFQLLFLFRNVN